jgi:aminoglycoside phosphotransferase (APT) family kinase protein
MDVEGVREALAGLDEFSAPDPIEPILGGWSFWTFRLGADHVVRFPKNEAVARGLEREVALLPELAECVSFQVPVPVAVGRHEGLPFAVHPWIDGRSIAARDVVSGIASSPNHAGEGRARVAEVLAQLHGFPNRRAAELIGTSPGVESWRERYLGLRNVIQERVEPLLDVQLRDRVAEAFVRFVEEGLSHFSHPVLVHCDLGAEHFRVNEDGRVVGVIDFEECAIGDPAIDFVGLQIAFGDDVTRDVLARWGGPPDPGFRERLHAYVWMGSVEAILYGLDEGDDGIVADGIEGLQQRIEE